ncbi:MAG: hypothetical protein ACK56F_06120, partial [bacterium]
PPPDRRALCGRRSPPWRGWRDGGRRAAGRWPGPCPAGRGTAWRQRSRCRPQWDWWPLQRWPCCP